MQPSVASPTSLGEVGFGAARGLMEHAVQGSTSGIVISDPNLPDDPIVYANPAFERISGYSTDEILGRNCRFMQADDRDQPALEELRAALREGRDCRVIVRNYRKNGEMFWNELYVSPVVDEEGRLVNFMGVQNDVTERVKGDEARDLVLLGEQVARENAEATGRGLALLAKAGMILSSSLQYPTTVARVARLVVPAFADWCLVDLLDEDGFLRQLAAAHADPRREGLLRSLGELRGLDSDELLEGNRVSATVLKNGEPLVVAEITDELLVENSSSKEHLALWRELDPRSALVVPLRVRGRTFGAVSFVSSRCDLRYGASDLAFATDLAYLCALAIDNSRLYRERSAVARALQGSLLPDKLPEVPGLEVGLRYLPAGESQVGGDFYDLFDARTSSSEDADGSCPAGLSSWGVVIGDVVGKGVGAAAVLTLARHTIRAFAMREARPDLVLASLNEAMLRQARERGDHKFCTVAYARLDVDPEGTRATVSLGGHPQPLILRSGGGVERVGHLGRAIGVFEDADLSEEEVLLVPGDALVLYTDGVTEARAPGGGFFGEERLHALLKSSTGLDADEIAGRIERAVLDFQDNEPHDDVAVLVVGVGSF